MEILTNTITKVVLFLITEFAEFCVANSRENSTSSSIARSLWDGKNVEVNRRKDPVSASNHHVGIIGHITKQEFSIVTKSKDYFNGLLNRFIFCYVDRSKILPSPLDIDKINISKQSTVLADVFSFINKYDEKHPLVFELTKEAEDLWEKFYYEHSFEDENPIIDTMGARIPPHAKRLAMIFSILDKSTVINQYHLKASIDVCEYHEATIKYLFTRETSALQRLPPVGRKLLEYLSNQDKLSASKTEIINKVFKNNGSALQWDSLRDLLTSLGMISFTSIDGKEVWQLMSK